MASRLAATVAAGLLALSARAGPAAAPPVVIAYVYPRDASSLPTDVAADQLTHVNYAFAVVHDGLVVERAPTDAANLKALVELRRAHPHLAVLVSVGGWTDSGGFSDAVLTPESRRRFVESAMGFVVRHDIDGLDVDWEYPGLPGYGNTHRPEDKENFTALMAGLRAVFDKKGAETKRRYLLTFAAGAFSDFLAHVEMDKVQASVDFVNLMTYDFREAGADAEAGHHANLYPNPLDPKQSSADRAVREFSAAGVPAAKLVLGVPFYGRAWGDVKPEGNGLYQPGREASEPVDTSYASLARDYVDRNGYRRIWDDRAQAPFLWNAEKRIFISYEDPESLGVKSRYVLEHGLGGVMFWEYNSDRTGSLLETLWRELRNPSPPKGP